MGSCWAETSRCQENRKEAFLKLIVDFSLHTIVLVRKHVDHVRVEYFGQRMEGFVFTEHGWVQSYGSRYVRPPIIHGDVTRPHAMTTKEFKFAQSLTQKPVKGMLTGMFFCKWSSVTSAVAGTEQDYQYFPDVLL